MNNTKQNKKTALFEMPVSDFYKEILDKQAMQIHGCIGPNSTIFFSTILQCLILQSKQEV